MSLNETLNTLRQQRADGLSIHDALDILKARSEVNRLRGQALDELELAVCASMVSLPITLDELEPSSESLNLLEQLTRPGQVISQSTRTRLSSLNLTLTGNKGKLAFNDHTLVLALRLARWRTGAIKLPGNLGESPVSLPLISSANLISGYKPDESTFLSLSTRHSRIGELTPEQLSRVCAGRLHMTQPEFTARWETVIRTGMNQNDINLVLSQNPQCLDRPLSRALLPPALRTALEEGPLAQQPGVPLRLPSQEALRELRSLPTGDSYGLHLELMFGLHPLTVPEHEHEQRELLEWLSRANTLMAVPMTHFSLMNVQLPGSNEPLGTDADSKTPQTEEPTLSAEAHVRWVRLSDPEVKTNQPATRTLLELMRRMPNRNSINRQNLALRCQLITLWLQELMSGAVSHTQRVYSTEIKKYELRELAQAASQCGTPLSLLSDYVILRNEFLTYAVRHHKNMDELEQLISEELHLPWQPLSPQERHRRSEKITRHLEAEVQQQGAVRLS